MDQNKKPESPLEILKEATEAGELNHLPKEFLEALSEGRVEVMGENTSDEDVLAKDGEATLALVRETHMPVGQWGELFALCVSNPGGFSSVIVSEREWEVMKTKIDNLIQQKKEEANAQANTGPGVSSPEGAGREN